jgi:hypothetical protein
MAVDVSLDLARQWANELFQLSLQDKGPGRSMIQDFAMSILARTDPDRALELLHQMDLSEEPQGNGVWLPHMQLVQQVFMTLVRRDGENALPILEREAAFMGSQGFYPYSSLGQATTVAVGKDWTDNRQHGIQVQQSVLNLAFSRYSQTGHTYPEDLDFGKMLQQFAGSLPFDSVQPALHLVVTNLLATDTNKYRFQAQVYTREGESARADNAIDAAILWLGMLINRDPDLVHQLESTRPELQTGLEYVKTGRSRSMNFRAIPPSAPNAQARRQDVEGEMDALSLCRTNVDAAIARAEQLPDAQRLNTELEIARRVAGDHPDQAAKLIAEVKSSSPANDDKTQINMISAQAYVAAAQDNQSELHALLERGFELTNRIALGEQKGIVIGPGPLLQIGMQNDPELTTTFLRDLPPSQMKAYLLMGAASALRMANMGRRLPMRSGPN